MNACWSVSFALSFHELADVPQEKFDASRMHVMPDVAAQERLVDDGSGQKQVRRRRVIIIIIKGVMLLMQM